MGEHYHKLSSFHETARDEAENHLEHNCRLAIYGKRVLRKTGIVGTIGPSCNTLDTVIQMIKAGMNIARINLGHGTIESNRSLIRLVREASRAVPETYVAVAVDTKGPKIRTGPTKDDKPLHLVENAEVIVKVDPESTKICSTMQIYIDYANLGYMVKEGQDILLNNGAICLRVGMKSPEGMVCKVINGGYLASRRTVHLPAAHVVDLPVISDKDRKDLEMAMEEEVDMVFASCVRGAMDVFRVRRALDHVTLEIPVIAKIENEDGLRFIDKIIEQADGILIARGPLGAEMPSEKLSIIQKAITSKCNRACKPVLVSTQMLESMTHNMRATRAECSDVANAVLDGADCVILTNETSAGEHPIEAVHMMDLICAEAEVAYYHRSLMRSLGGTKNWYNPLETIAMAASSAVSNIHASAIILVTTSGRSAQYCAQFRPPVPIIALCCSERIARQLHLFRGILPYFYDGCEHLDASEESVDESTRIGIGIGKRRGFIAKGDPVALITGWPNDKLSMHSMLQLVFAD